MPKIAVALHFPYTASKMIATRSALLIILTSASSAPFSKHADCGRRGIANRTLLRARCPAASHHPTKGAPGAADINAELIVGADSGRLIFAVGVPTHHDGLPQSSEGKSAALAIIGSTSAPRSAIHFAEKCLHMGPPNHREPNPFTTYVRFILRGRCNVTARARLPTHCLRIGSIRPEYALVSEKTAQIWLIRSGALDLLRAGDGTRYSALQTRTAAEGSHDSV